jgi:hypothetical protein
LCEHRTQKQKGKRRKSKRAKDAKAKGQKREERKSNKNKKATEVAFLSSTRALAPNHYWPS